MNGTNPNQMALSVTDVNRYIKSLFGSDGLLSAVAVRGEISNFKAHSSGHLYFTLKDGSSELAAVMFRGDAMRMGFRPMDGMRVIAYGRVDVYEKSGRYQLYAGAIVADGVGALAAAYEKLKKKLEAEGLFAPERKRPLPEFPTCVGVITAPTGAAIRDIINITGRRYPQAKLILYPSLVQGQDAPASLCAGLAYFNAMKSCDVIILGRGGGSVEDLWAFNDETLARTVAASTIPVISAVGHETDFTLCDFVADRRAPTPSAAAEIAVPDRRELAQRLSERYRSLTRRAEQTLTARKSTLLLAERALELRSPYAKLAHSRQHIEHQTETMERLMKGRMDKENARLSTAAERLQALSPLAVLGRGYSMVRDEAGQAVSSATRLTVGQQVDLQFSDGQATAEIRTVEATKSKKEITHGR
ncbi:MAG: exodeoxyribonuclease VII large subunit [Ruminococcaceae bacterium]|nr:exodeoxyribonuclease VII large subunit [Oscillospiraceae bacterium]